MPLDLIVLHMDSCVQSSARLMHVNAGDVHTGCNGGLSSKEWSTQ
jgi:hypothetical protein